MAEKLYFSSDYMEGAHPHILSRLVETNLDKTEGYGTDRITNAARERVREACGCPDAEVEFLVGGTQTNATVLDALLRSYQGVIAAETGHIATHEAGAIEFGGHKVLTVAHTLGKMSVSDLRAKILAYEEDGNRDHLVMPGVVYLSQPTEFGTLYSLAELTAISELCHEHGLLLYVDGARLAYALASDENDAALPDLARLCDALYIGGTKCGAMIGEAVVIPDPDLIPHFFTIIKQHGALLAKGRILGIQFDELFKDGLYFSIGDGAIRLAKRMKKILTENGFTLTFDAPTNQVFVTLADADLPRFGEKIVYSFWDKPDAAHTAVRLATSWATTDEDLDAFEAFCKTFYR